MSRLLFSCRLWLFRSQEGLWAQTHLPHIFLFLLTDTRNWKPSQVSNLLFSAFSWLNIVKCTGWDFHFFYIILPLHLQLLLSAIIIYFTTYWEGHKKSSQTIYNPAPDIFSLMDYMYQNIAWVRNLGEHLHKWYRFHSLKSTKSYNEADCQSGTPLKSPLVSDYLA